jgi:hypothetical protein
MMKSFSGAPNGAIAMGDVLALLVHLGASCVRWP